jgi:endonuclease-8
MPEGDTIHRIAASLAPRLTGKALERVTTQGLLRDLAGRTVTSVAAHGKHLVIELDNGATLRAHLGMNGRFRAYDRAAGEARLARISPGRASLAVVTDDGVYLWIGAPTIEIAHRRHPRHGMAVATLGPDILSNDFDIRLAAGRAAAHGSRIIADVLLDQRVVAGIGNIYKCEALFLAGVDPRTQVDQLDADRLAQIYAAACQLMRASVAPSPEGPDQAASSTRPPAQGATARAPFWVYSHTGKPCRRCGTRITCASLGDPARWTWSCPTCQPAAANRSQR